MLTIPVTTCTDVATLSYFSMLGLLQHAVRFLRLVLEKFGYKNMKSEEGRCVCVCVCVCVECECLWIPLSSQRCSSPSIIGCTNWHLLTTTPPGEWLRTSRLKCCLSKRRKWESCPCLLTVRSAGAYCFSHAYVEHMTMCWASLQWQHDGHGLTDSGTGISRQQAVPVVLVEITYMSNIHRLETRRRHADKPTASNRTSTLTCHCES